MSATATCLVGGYLFGVISTLAGILWIFGSKKSRARL